MSADPRLTALVRAHLANMDEVKRLEAELAAAKLREPESATALWDALWGEFHRNYLLTDGTRYLVLRAEYAARLGTALDIHVDEVAVITHLDYPPRSGVEAHP